MKMVLALNRSAWVVYFATNLKDDRLIKASIKHKIFQVQSDNRQRYSNSLND